MLDSISYQELLQWGEYFDIEPFGEWRGDVRAANICAVTANINRDPKKRPEPFTIQDFMIFDKAAKKAARDKEAEEKGARIDPNLTAWLFEMGRRTEERSKAKKR